MTPSDAVTCMCECGFELTSLVHHHSPALSPVLSLTFLFAPNQVIVLQSRGWADVYCFPAQSKRKAHAVRLRMQSGPRSLQDHRLEAMRAERQSITDTHQHLLKHIDSSAHWQFSRPCHAAHAQNCYRHTCLSLRQVYVEALLSALSLLLSKQSSALHISSLPSQRISRESRIFSTKYVSTIGSTMDGCFVPILFSAGSHNSDLASVTISQGFSIVIANQFLFGARQTRLTPTTVCRTTGGPVLSPSGTICSQRAPDHPVNHGAIEFDHGANCCFILDTATGDRCHESSLTPFASLLCKICVN